MKMGATVGADFDANVSNVPQMFRVVARGGSSTSHPVEGGIYTMDGTLFSSTPSRSYNLKVYDRSTGQWGGTQKFDVYSSIDNANALEAALNALTSSQIFVLFTHDEPITGRTPGMLTAVYKNGGSRTIFGSANFRFRSAYILIGVGKIGEGNGIELYAGDISGDPDAWVETTITIKNGNIQLGNIKARNAVDISLC